MNNQSLASYSGVIWKTALGLLIAFTIAINNLQQGDLFLAFMYQGGLLYRLVVGTIATIVIGIVWFALYKSLYKDKGPILNLIMFVLCTGLLGLFFGNSLIITTSWISYYAQGAVDAQMVQDVLRMTGYATMIAVIGGIIMLPKIKLSGKNIKFAKNAVLILGALALSGFVLWIIAMVLAIFGFTALLEQYFSVFYGLGPISLVLSIFSVVIAEVLFLGSLTYVKTKIDVVPKNVEYALAMHLVNGIVRIYIQLFKTIFKIVARRKR